MTTAQEAWVRFASMDPAAEQEWVFLAGWDAAMHELGGDPRVIPSRTTDPSTSHRAASAITVKAGTQRARLLDAFDDQSWLYTEGHSTRDGLTDEEAALSAPGVSLQSEYSKRCSELREAGFIEPTGETRKGSSGMDRIVSRITDKGRAAVRTL